jgi:hypothetical protein
MKIILFGASGVVGQGCAYLKFQALVLTDLLQHHRVKWKN